MGSGSCLVFDVTDLDSCSTTSNGVHAEIHHALYQMTVHRWSRKASIPLSIMNSIFTLSTRDMHKRISVGYTQNLVIHNLFYGFPPKLPRAIAVTPTFFETEFCADHLPHEGRSLIADLTISTITFFITLHQIISCAHDFYSSAYSFSDSVNQGPGSYLRESIKTPNAAPVCTSVFWALNMLFSSLLGAISLIGSALAFTATPFVPYVILIYSLFTIGLFNHRKLILPSLSASIPLAVRSPYASTWLPGGTGGSLGASHTLVRSFTQLIRHLSRSWDMASILDRLHYGVGGIRPS